MRKINYKLFLLGFVALSLFSTLFTACKDELLPEADRLFRPVLSDDDIEAGLDADTIPYIKVDWDKYADADQYIVKAVATDGTDSVTITTDSSSCTFKNMNFDKEYNVLIRSKNTVSGLESRDFVMTTTTPDYPTRLFGVTSTNIIDTQVRVMWFPTVNGSATVYDTIRVYSVLKDSMEAEVAVTSADLDKHSKIIRKLTPSTEYRIEAYNKGKYQGKKLFKTAAPESYTGKVYDLRGLTEDESYKYFSTSATSLYKNTIDSLIIANPDQNITFVLQGGVTYRMPTLLIPSTIGKIKFVTGLTLNGNAAFAVSGNFDAAASVQIGGFEFQKIFFTDAPLEGKLKTGSNFSDAYLFNFGAAGAKIGSIKIENCQVKYKRGICRTKEAVVIDTLSINNCIVDSIAGYGILTADHASTQVKNVFMSNSTFSNCEKILQNTKSTALPVSNVIARNCSFIYCVSTNKGYFFDYSGCTISNSFEIKNCLFGRPGTLKSGTLLNGAAGWRCVNSPIFSDCYMTTDFNRVFGTDGVTLVNPIDGTVLTTDTPSSFKAPLMSDFTVIDEKLKKLKTGDPRWY